MIVRAALIILVLVAAAALRAAEPAIPSPVVVVARGDAERALLAELAVDDLRRRAWAAYEIGARGLGAGRSSLLALASTAPDDGDRNEVRCYLSILDAIARLPGDTPTEVVRIAASRIDARSIALVLAAREPKHHRATLEALLAEDSSDPVWLAVRQLLVALRSPALAEDLARDLTLKLRISVRDSMRIGGGRRRATMICGDGTVKVEDDFPPKVFYSLSLSAEPGAVVLCDGFAPVYWQREEYGVESGVGSTRSPLDRDAARLSLLATLGGGETELRTTTEAFVTWSDAEAYAKDVTAARERVVAARHGLLAPLIGGGLLADDFERAHPVRVAVTIDDYRVDKNMPLPALPFAEAPSK